METWRQLSEFTDLPFAETEPEELPPLPEVAAPVAPSEVPPGDLAWERPGLVGLPGRLVETASQIFSRPATTFRGLDPNASIARALVYYLLLATISTWICIGYDMLLALFVPDMLPKHPITGKMVPFPIVAGIFVLKAVVAPFFLAGIVFVASGFLHMLLMMFGVSEPNFMVTVRVYCYAIGTAFLLMLIPACGVLIFLPTSVMLLVVGLKEAHGTDFVRPAIAVILPVAALIFLYGLLLVVTQAGVIK